jgi:hypothetical protein
LVYLHYYSLSCINICLCDRMCSFDWQHPRCSTSNVSIGLQDSNPVIGSVTTTLLSVVVPVFVTVVYVITSLILHFQIYAVFLPKAVLVCCTLVSVCVLLPIAVPRDICISTLRILSCCNALYSLSLHQYLLCDRICSFDCGIRCSASNVSIGLPVKTNPCHWICFTTLLNIVFLCSLL